MSEQWDDQADVVVVGFGGAGGAAAVAAADLGASVIVLEKQPENNHTPSTLMASRSIIVRVNDVDGATKYFDRAAGGLIPLAVSRAWAERAINVLDWLTEACDFPYVRQPEPHAQHPTFEGAESIEVYRATDESIAKGGLFGSLRDAAARKGVKVLWQSPGKRLIQGEDGRVIGVEVPQQGGGTRRIGATKGVILTCGGFEFDEELKRNFLKAFPIYFYGNPGNEGDGIRMAQAVGADLWHMNLMFGRAIAHFELDDHTPLNFLIDVNPAVSNPFANRGLNAEPAGYAITDKFGRRFADETEQVDMIAHLFHFELFNYDVPARDYARIPCYWFFDQRRMNAGPLIGGGSGNFSYTWSADNEKEIERGWIKRADTIEELAAAMGMPDPRLAAAAIATYNEASASGNDPWGRNKESMVPLDKPPYYCMPLYPGGPATAGGPRRNEYAQILDPFGEPIAGLFAAGELGEPLGLLYPHHGCNLCECICFGQIAAEAAVTGVPS